MKDMEDNNTTSLLIQLFQLAEKDGLNPIEQQQIIEAVSSYGRSLKPNDFQKKFKNIRTGTRALLEQIENCLDSSVKSVSEWHNIIAEIKTNDGKLPAGADISDDAETIEFINSLKKEYYNFSDAEKLIGPSRQSISIWAKEGRYSIKTIQKGERTMFTKIGIIEFYKAYNNKDGFNF